MSNNLNDVVLLGHSFGGTIIAKVAEIIPDRLRRLIFENGFVLNDADCLNDNVPPHYRALFDSTSQASEDFTVMVPFPIWREAFINDADLELATWSYEQLSSEPYQSFLNKLDMKKFFSLEIPKSYINCAEDTSLPHGEWCWHPRMSNRLGLFRLVQMPGSHEVIFSNSIGLAEKIIEAGRD